MATFEGDVLSQTVAVAKKHSIDPAALLAVVEVESAGRSLEIDGMTPTLLFERHIFYRELNKARPEKLQRAVSEGLAIPKWNRATQYKDQGTSKGRLTVFGRARSIDEECAIRSCSWGVGQTMGFLYPELRFRSATEMLAYMVAGGVPAQIELMVREIENKKLVAKLNNHDWAAFARVYNGPGYAQNAYDTKMAKAYAVWLHKMPDIKPVEVKPVTVPDDMPKPVEPQPPEEKPKTGKSIGASLAAILTAIAAAFSNNIYLTVAILIVAIIFVVLAIVTYRRLHDQTPVMLRGTLDEHQS